MFTYLIKRSDKMATRSSIAYKTTRGLTAAYCHWDGYPEGVGATLNEHYQAAYKINQLVIQGDMSYVAPECMPHSKAHSFENPEDGVTVYYGRDRGEKNTDAKEFDTIADWLDWYTDINYAYLWDGRNWLVHARGDVDDNGFPVFDLVTTKLGMRA
jgi:hypothetical protein